MATVEEYLKHPVEERVDRLRRTPDEIAAGVKGQPEAALSRRPDARSWCPTEIVCHLRDVEELFQTRFHTILGLDEPTIFVFGAPPATQAAWGIGGRVTHPLDPDRWAEDRQYRRSDPADALAALRRRREEVVALLESLSPAQWRRVGIHPAHGRLTLGDWVARLAAHDDNHLDQLRRALAGRP
jgi:hypothetical protein